MPENIINLDAHRKDKPTAKVDFDVIESMSMIEDTLELLDELGVTTRDELVELLEALESSAPEIPE